MKKTFILLTLFISIFSLLFSNPGLVINEIMYNPDGNDEGKEWIELYSNASKSINLKGWGLEKAGKKFERIFTFPEIILQPDSFLVIGEDNISKSDLNCQLGLDNATDHTAGVRIISDEGKTINTVFYGSPSEFSIKDSFKSIKARLAPKAKEGYSISRYPDGKVYIYDTNIYPSPFPSPGFSNILLTDFNKETFDHYLDAQTDKEKYLILNRTLSLYESFEDEEEILDLAHVALKLAKKLNSKEKIAGSYLQLGIIHDYFNNFKRAGKYFSNSLIIFKELGEKRDIANLYNNLGIIRHRFAEYDSAISYFQKSITLKNELGMEEKTSSSYSNMAQAYNAKGEVFNQIDCLNKANKIIKENNQKRNSMSTFQALGNAYKQLGDYENATKNYIAGMDIAQQLKCPRIVAQFANNIANIFKKVYDYQKALKYYQKSENVFNKTGNDIFAARAQANKAATLVHLKKFDLAEKNYKEALKVIEKTENSNIKCIITSNMGTMYIKRNQLDKAEKYFNRAKVIVERNNISEFEANLLSNYGKIAYKRNKLNKAKAFFKKSLHIAEEYHLINFIQNCYKWLAKIYAQQNSYKSAYEYSNKLATTQDSLQAKQQRGYISNLATKQEKKNLERTVFTLEEKSKIKDLRTKNLKTQKFLFLALIVVLILIISFIAYRYYLNRKMNSKLAKLVDEKTRNLQKSNKELIEEIEQRKKLEKQLKISERLAGIGEMAARLAHKIRNPLAVISSTAQFLNTGKAKNAELKDYSQRIVESATRANDIIKSLLKFSVHKERKKISSNLTPILAHIIKIIQPTLKNNNITLKDNIPDKLVGLKFDSNQIEEVFSNLTINALAAMKNGGKLSIVAKNKIDKIIVSISDTGKGIPEEEIDKIFEPFFTTKDEGTGLGLSLVHKIIDSYDGTIQVSSKLNEGTTFTVELPKTKQENQDE